ncbi:Restriction endonuclease [Micromonospora sp. MW-13]|uniref:restriction endonuclease n=1 Tax=Micromonospora sp. MW-13 TaxID=2094022 RepID=UPI000EDB2031|nr:restriction endonuclease [Micromonospora sp. MW-13]RGC67648.1 Restriction endonuclease [Micromonospora sp. MW-13]
MPYVKSHIRRDGARVRAHYRKRRRARGGGAARRGRSGSAAPLLWGVPALVLVVLAVDFVRRHPYWSVLLVAVVGLAVAGLLFARARQRARQRAEQERQRAEQARRDRLIAVTDAMSGPEFERWFARLLEASGFRQVTVTGGAGDRGADVVAVAPDGRRVVVQCKRQSAHNRVGSAAIQRFAGTCREVHGGQLCVIVTNSFFTAGDGVRLARQLDIALVDRAALETWAWTRTPPPGLCVAR